MNQSEAQNNKAIGKSRLGVVVLIVLLLAGFGLGVFYWTNLRQIGASHLLHSRVDFPEKVILEDFQRPLDRDLTEQLVAFEQTGISKFIDANLLKPYFDDVNTRQLTFEGVELRLEQFPDRQDLHRVMETCAKILDIPKPAVYIHNSVEVNAYAANMTEPLIVITSGFLRVFQDPAELRFVIGHEMGHIKCRHVKWKMILSGIVESMRRLPGLPEEVSLLPYLPLFKWAREAEMSADNAGLICAQDREAAEWALVRLAVGLSQESIGRINVDAFLEQRNAENLSQFSEVLLYWRQLLREHPFIADRIGELRKYEQTRHYQHLWESL